jgi:hypothetical protein
VTVGPLDEYRGWLDEPDPDLAAMRRDALERRLRVEVRSTVLRYGSPIGAAR